jgi:hypothetical protein
VWRAYIKNSEMEVKSGKKSKTGNANMDKLTALMKGTKISKP